VFGQAYEIAFVSHAGRVRYYIDGEKVHDWQDPDPLDGGYFALRTFCTVLECRDLLIAKVASA